VESLENDELFSAPRLLEDALPGHLKTIETEIGCHTLG